MYVGEWKKTRENKYISELFVALLQIKYWLLLIRYFSSFSICRSISSFSCFFPSIQSFLLLYVHVHCILHSQNDKNSRQKIIIFNMLTIGNNSMQICAFVIVNTMKKMQETRKHEIISKMLFNIFIYSFLFIREILFFSLKLFYLMFESDIFNTLKFQSFTCISYMKWNQKFFQLSE